MGRRECTAVASSWPVIRTQPSPANEKTGRPGSRSASYRRGKLAAGRPPRQISGVAGLRSRGSRDEDQPVDRQPTMTLFERIVNRCFLDMFRILARHDRRRPCPLPQGMGPLSPAIVDDFEPDAAHLFFQRVSRR